MPFFKKLKIMLEQEGGGGRKKEEEEGGRRKRRARATGSIQETLPSTGQRHPPFSRLSVLERVTSRLV